jgi:hypothetical protein
MGLFSVEGMGLGRGAADYYNGWEMVLQKLTQKNPYLKNLPASTLLCATRPSMPPPTSLSPQQSRSKDRRTR